MRERSTPSRYSLSRKIVTTGENFWNIYWHATNQMREETAKVAAKPQHGLVTT